MLLAIPGAADPFVANFATIETGDRQFSPCIYGGSHGHLTRFG
jgi:hypothetical protein